MGPPFTVISFGPPFLSSEEKSGLASLKLQPQDQQPQKRYSEFGGGGGEQPKRLKQSSQSRRNVKSKTQ